MLTCGFIVILLVTSVAPRSSRAPSRREMRAESPTRGLPAPAAVLVACALTLAQYLAAYMRMPLVPVFARALGASTVQVGMINAVFMGSAMLLSVPLGLVSDRLGRRRLVLAGMAISGLTSLLLV